MSCRAGVSTIDGRREYGNRTDLKRSLVMPEFRYYCLNDAGRIMRGVHVTAPTLAEAIQTAHRDCAAHPTQSSGIEVWQDDRCLYRSGDRSGQAPAI